mmetsp:Transcript_53136/g.147356  ORF Transcript_53136/g.147356 Transcript_53136/m.147356 type:complete len:160 (-) Transcript_53136:19-498(-)
MERKAWRKNHPYGFVAKPKTKSDGSTDLMVWDVIIPGKEGTIWEGCKLPLEMHFSADYPSNPPIVKTVPVLWHMNVWSSGRICLSILNPPDGKKFANGMDHGAWCASVTIKQIVLGVQDLLNSPYPAGARAEVEGLWKRDRAAYDKRLKEEADKYRSDD